ncbi:MAG: hydantoinase B/oxoprolinase family protein [Chloroflexi bacterium]|nr:hydantoinase B/oxoprolinase family protein [Chloroflexota bacterium]
MSTVDPITLQVISSNLSGIVNEMQMSLYRTGFSTIIRESHDASCGLLDAQGRLAGQYLAGFVHGGSFAPSVQELLRWYPPQEMEEGDVFLVNHPYYSGSPHAMDWMVMTPVFFQGELVAFAGSIAHKSDIGGMVPGSGSGRARELYQEGLHLPPVRYFRHGQLVREVVQIIRHNSRTPDLVIGDINGQMGSTRVGEARLKKLFEKYGTETALAAFEEIFDKTRQRVKAAIASWPDGETVQESYLDNDGINLDKLVRLEVTVTKRGDSLRLGFSGCARQTEGPVNIRPAIVRSACLYGLIALVDHTLPCNYGLESAFDIDFGPPGTITNPVLPAPLTAYAATAGRICEMVVQALAHLSRRPEVAGSGGNFTFMLGTRGPDASGQRRTAYVQYEILSCGCGAVAGVDGGTGWFGTRRGQAGISLPAVEILESEFPVRLARFEHIPGSGGPGQFRGGPGFVREYVMLEPARFSSRGDRFAQRPPGAVGGLPGRAGAIVINPDRANEQRPPARTADIPLEAGDILRLEMGGGGGVGDPQLRERARLLADLEDGFVTPEQARAAYGPPIVPLGKGDYRG